VGDILTRTDVLLSPLLLSTARFDELRGLERRLALESTATPFPCDGRQPQTKYRPRVVEGLDASRALLELGLPADSVIGREATTGR